MQIRHYFGLSFSSLTLKPSINQVRNYLRKGKGLSDIMMRRLIFLLYGFECIKILINATKPLTLMN